MFLQWAMSITFTEDNFVPYEHGKGRLGGRHRSLVTKNVIRSRRERYLKVGIPGLRQFPLELARVPGFKEARHEAVQGETAAQPTQDESLDEAYVDTFVLPQRTTISGNAHDPFDSLPISKTGALEPARTISDLFNGWSPIIQYESGTKPSDIQHPFLSKLLPMAVQHADLLGAVLTDGQYWRDVFMAPVSSGTMRPASTLREVLCYRGQAITHIRTKLSAKVSSNGVVASESTILAVMFLMGVDSYQGDSQSAASHRRAIRMLVQAHGGLSHLSPFARSLLLMYNFFLPSVFDYESYAGALHSSATWQKVVQSDAEQLFPQLPPTFKSVFGRYSLSLQLLDIVVRTQKWTSVLQRLWSRKATTEDFDSFAHCEAVLILDDLAHVRPKLRSEYEHNGESRVQESNLEMILTLTLIPFLLNTLWRGAAQNWSIYLEPLMRATEFLSYWLRSRDAAVLTDSPIRNAFLWCTMVAIDSWRREGVHVESQGLTLLDLLFSSSIRPHDWHATKTVLEASLSCDAMLLDWHICWQVGWDRWKSPKMLQSSRVEVSSLAAHDIPLRATLPQSTGPG